MFAEHVPMENVGWGLGRQTNLGDVDVHVITRSGNPRH